MNFSDVIKTIVRPIALISLYGSTSCMEQPIPRATIDYPQRRVLARREALPISLSSS